MNKEKISQSMQALLAETQTENSNIPKMVKFIVISGKVESLKTDIFVF